MRHICGNVAFLVFVTFLGSFVGNVFLAELAMMNEDWDVLGLSQPTPAEARRQLRTGRGAHPDSAPAPPPAAGARICSNAHCDFAPDSFDEAEAQCAGIGARLCDPWEVDFFNQNSDTMAHSCSAEDFTSVWTRGTTLSGATGLERPLFSGLTVVPSFRDGGLECPAGQHIRVNDKCVCEHDLDGGSEHEHDEHEHDDEHDGEYYAEECYPRGSAPAGTGEAVNGTTCSVEEQFTCEDDDSGSGVARVTCCAINACIEDDGHSAGVDCCNSIAAHNESTVQCSEGYTPSAGASTAECSAANGEVRTICTAEGETPSAEYVDFNDGWICEGKQADEGEGFGWIGAIFQLVFFLIGSVLTALGTLYYYNKSQNTAPFNGESVPSYPSTKLGGGGAAVAVAATMQMVQMQCPEGSSGTQSPLRRRCRGCRCCCCCRRQRRRRRRRCRCRCRCRSAVQASGLVQG
jgi:hypothetical protein